MGSRYRSLDNPFDYSNATMTMPFHIESTAYCPNGIAPRWTWWIHGIACTHRYGVVGTDEKGHGLYLYESHGDQVPNKILLLDVAAFKLADDISKTDATSRLTAALVQLGWRPATDIKPVAKRSTTTMAFATTVQSVVE